MFFSTAFLASLFAASTVSAAPLQRRKPFFESVSVSEISAIEVESLSASEFVPTAAVFCESLNELFFGLWLIFSIDSFDERGRREHYHCLGC